MPQKLVTLLTAKQAAKIAVDFIEGFYRDLGQDVQDVLLEEIELSDDAKAWQITVGFSRLGRASSKASAAMSEVLMPRYERARQYKTVSVDRATGDIPRMKIRTVD